MEKQEVLKEYQNRSEPMTKGEHGLSSDEFESIIDDVYIDFEAHEKKLKNMYIELEKKYTELKKSIDHAAKSHFELHENQTSINFDKKILNDEDLKIVEENI